MKCTKCGNELKDGVKFCPQCGEEVKEEKKEGQKIKYCTKCGAEIQPGSSFCAKCGAGVNGVQEQEKPKKFRRQGGKYKKIFLVAGIAIAVLLSVGGVLLNSDKAMYKAYVKFHEEYCDKYAEYDEYNDCAARIIMSPQNEKWLAIWDITNIDEEHGGGDIFSMSGKDKITLYRYSWGRVKKVATFSKETVGESEFANFSVIDNELYFLVDCYGDVSKKGNLTGAYRLNGEKFEAVKANEEKRKYIDYWNEEAEKHREWYEYIHEARDTGMSMDEWMEEILDGMDPDEEYSIVTTDSGMGLREFVFLGNVTDQYEKGQRQLCAVNDVRYTNVNEFAEITNELSKYKIKDQTDLQVAYGKIFKEFGLWS